MSARNTTLESVDMDVLELRRGNGALLVSLPHEGTALPDGLADRLTDPARRLPDTDWHLARLYAFAAEAFDATILRPRYSRYVVDLNRPRDGVPLYPGRHETGLVPLGTFAGEPIYRPGQEPGIDEVAERVARWWQPYHDALAAELTRLRAMHRHVLLWEGHSIRSVLPLLFSGRLPEFNLGTADGASCRNVVREQLATVIGTQVRWSHALDGRFKGGYITRHYGRPAAGVDAVQLELAQSTYMDEDTQAYRDGPARLVAGMIRRMMSAALC